MSAPTRTALVTGGTAGIGLRIAETLQGDGFLVAVAARRAERVRALEGRGFAGYVLDVVDEDALSACAGDLRRRFARLDVLVNAAGIVDSGDLAELSPERVRRVLSANLEGTVLATQAMLPLLRAARGTVVNFSSGLVRRPMSGTAVYSAAKGGVEAFTRALALEVGPDGVRVNCVAPSLVRSEIWISAGMSPETYERVLAERGAEYPLGRAGEPDDVASAVSFLVSARSGWITGAILPVDGGSSIGAVKRR